MISGFEAVSIFTDLEFKTLEDISDFSELLVLSDGEELIAENDTSGTDMYVLREGNVEILSNGSGITSGDISISKQDKEIFGEISWLSGHKRSATIRCVGDVEVIRIDGDSLSTYMLQHPEAGFVIMRRIAILLALRLDQTNNLLKQVLWNSNI